MFVAERSKRERKRVCGGDGNQWVERRGREGRERTHAKAGSVAISDELVEHVKHRVGRRQISRVVPARSQTVSDRL